MDRRLIKPSARRCLFGRPDNSDGFVQRQKRLEADDAAQFAERWNFTDNPAIDNENEPFQWIKTNPEDVPSFYTKIYSHKCRRRALRPCVGKSLTFADSDNDDDQCDVTMRASFDTADSVEVFIGVLPHHTPLDKVTPQKSDREDTQTNKSEESTPSVNRVALKRKLTQKRLTDIWRVLKRRPRCLSPAHKRARVGRL